MRKIFFQCSYFKQSVKFWFIILIVMVSCSKYQDPKIEVVENYSFSPIGNEQRSLAGQFLNDSIGVRITNNITGITSNLKVTFELETGSGELDKSEVVPDNSGIATVRWKIGNTGNQNLIARIFNDSGKELGTVPLSAFAFFKNSWNVVSSGKEINIRNMIADTVHKITLMSSNGLFLQDKNYFDWNIMPSYTGTVYSMIMDKLSNYYIGSWNGDVYKSSNQGRDWNKLSKPVSAYEGYISIRITPGVLWVSTSNHSLLCSRNDGLSWMADTIGLPSVERMAEIKLAANGDLYLTTLNGNLFKSEDGGKTWVKNKIIPNVRNIYINKIGEIILVGGYNGLTVFISNDNAVSFENVYSVSQGYGGWYFNFVTPYKDGYIVLLPGNALYFTKDFRNYTLFWNNSNITDIFKDVNGVLMMKDSQSYRVYYYDGD